ncbi:MAG: hypothetical protein ACJA1A_000417 [Saprospiraceae bacterium]|jgi:hypothetical protein
MECWSSLSNEIDTGMRYIFVILILAFWGCNKVTQQSMYVQKSNTTLSPPSISVDEAFFNIQTLIRVNDVDPKINIRYTIDETEPTQNSPLAKKHIIVSETGIYKFKAFQKEIKSSNTVSIETIEARKVNWIGLESNDPNETYNSGISVLTDHKKGDWNFRSDEWYGYQDSIVQFSFILEEGEVVNGAVVSTMIDQNSWIFSPENVRLTYHFEDGHKEKHELSIPDCIVQSKKQMNYLKITTPPRYPKKIDITVYNMLSIPDWHSGKGLKPWLFVDEILVL